MAPEEHAIDARAFADALREQRAMKLTGGLYHLNQIQLAYNTNRIEGSRLTEEQTRYLYETLLGRVVGDHPRCAGSTVQSLAQPLGPIGSSPLRGT